METRSVLLEVRAEFLNLIWITLSFIGLICIPLKHERSLVFWVLRNPILMFARYWLTLIPNFVSKPLFNTSHSKYCRTEGTDLWGCFSGGILGGVWQVVRAHQWLNISDGHFHSMPYSTQMYSTYTLLPLPSISYQAYHISYPRTEIRLSKPEDQHCHENDNLLGYTTFQRSVQGTHPWNVGLL